MRRIKKNKYVHDAVELAWYLAAARFVTKPVKDAVYWAVLRPVHLSSNMSVGRSVDNVVYRNVSRDRR